jgi:hypothetical protein
MVISRLKEAGLKAQHTAVKGTLSDEHKLYRLAFAESSDDRQWERVIFSDESAFSSANDGPGIVYRPRGQRYDHEYVSASTRSGHCWFIVGVGSPIGGMEYIA